ncbi:MAG: NADH-quinone oxidoreductase subunit L [Candidatus Binatia bacterium]
MPETVHELIKVDYLRWIVFLPLLGAMINGLGGALIQKAAGKRAVSVIACAPVVLAFALAVRGFVQLQGLAPDDRFLLDHLFTWLSVGSLHVDFAFQLDPLSSVMILIITGVGGLIHIYSTAYMHEEPAYWRYFAYLNLFTCAMLILVLGDNLLLMFVGWEGVGLCSYALIGFWYTDINNASAGSKAFIVNRIGDFGFMLGTFLLFWALAGQGHATLTFREIVANAGALEGLTFWGFSTVTVITLLMFVGATGKSAQIPLYVWLPDAMAGPTPVSALIHAATMVTAGVYMIARLNVLFTMAPDTLMVVMVVGTLTAFFAATIGTTQNDIKKVLAYSTVSQLGFMFIAMGAGAYAAGIFHLMTHAFFKACLFLGSGSVIHAMHHEQDMRKMGGLKRWMPITYWTFLISTLAISGIPPLSGFISKDSILWEAFVDGHHFIWVLGLCGAFMTAFYMFRLVYMTFHGEFRGDHHTQEHLHESPYAMTVPLLILAGLAAVAGFWNWPIALSPALPFLGVAQFEQWLRPVVGKDIGVVHGAEPHAAHHLDPIEYATMAASIVIAVSGILLARAMYQTKRVSPDRFAEAGGGFVYRTLLNKYYVDELYQVVVIGGTLWLSRAAAWFDRNVIDFIVNSAATVTVWIAQLDGLFDRYVVDGAVNGVGWLSSYLGGRVRLLQTGSINGYLYVIVIAVVGVMLAKLWWGPVSS